MKSGNAIEVRDVSKKFKIYRDKGHMLKERALHWSRNRYEVNQVLRGISFEVKKGEAIGLVGQNGCGKSTTLKMLTKIIYPDSGTIEMSGRVSSLLELGAGFHPDLSGRENIYINASIFGLSKQEIEKRLDSIIGFSELEDFIDNPVRTYSSGMYMRLAFSVAVNVNADILLIDEILAVGDANFQIKCFNKLLDIKRTGTTIIIVSHSLDQIEKICERSIWIHDGQIKMEGQPKNVHEEYLQFMAEARREHVKAEFMDNTAAITDDTAAARMGTGDARYIKVRSFDTDGKERNVFRMGERIRFELYYKVYQPVQEAFFGISIFRNDGVRCYGTNSKADNRQFQDIAADGMISVEFPEIQLLPGQYYLDISIEAKNIESVDYWSKVNPFEIIDHRNDIGVIHLQHEWSF